MNSVLKQINRMSTTPIPTERSVRSVDIRVLTSLPAGRMVPISAFPLLREDRIKSSTIRVSFELMETVEALLNAVNVNVKAYLVPHVAFERFSGFDELNRSYEGIPNQEGGPVTPYFETMDSGAYGSNDIHKYLGLHSPDFVPVNTAYVEAYNMIWNFRAKNRSKSLPLRAKLEKTLAKAFWQHDAFRHVVPDFDQAVIDGQVALNVVSDSLPVKSKPGVPIRVGYQGGNTGTLRVGNTSGNINKGGTIPGANQDMELIDGLWAELQQNGISVSLSNIALAEKTKAFAKLREMYQGQDNYITDLLMDGITIPEQTYRQPILLADKSTIFGIAKRYASDGPNLTKSVVNGMTYVDLQIVTPTIPCGGIVMLVAEITPEQLWERQADALLMTNSVDQLPQYLRDYLDPEKVEVMKNEEVDTSHGNPNGTFGYVPLNHRWAKSTPRVGGRYFRPTTNTAFDEDRQRIWAVETNDPVLSADFYVCNVMHTKPFVVTNKDIGEALARGMVNIEGNTVFGAQLIEADNDYNEVLANAPMDRIDKNAPVAKTPSPAVTVQVPKP